MYNLSTQEAEKEGSGVQGQAGLHIKALFKKKKKL
jgi:hypothetical protein